MSKSFYAIIVLALLAGCSAPRKHSPSTVNLGDLRDLRSDQVAGTSVAGIRYTALRDAALSLGARAGLAARSKELNLLVNRHDRLLERVFNFSRLVLEDNVLPPVLIEGRNTLDIANLDTIRVADRNYSIYSQARFVTTPPTWRDYLWLDFQPPEAPDRTLLPRDKAERLVWDEYVQQGWKAGIEQANNIFSESIARLKRDFIGMIRYRTLLAQNMVSAPFVAKIDLGVTGGGDELAVNERVLRITDMPTLSSDSQAWTTDLTQILPEHDNDMRFE